MTENSDSGGRFTNVEPRPGVTVASGDMVDRARELHAEAAARCSSPRPSRWPSSPGELFRDRTACPVARTRPTTERLDMFPPEAHARPEWIRTGHRHFPVAAEVDGDWWVLRLNPFPDHDMWTLFINGVARYDVTETPPTWGRPLTGSAPTMDPRTAHTVLAPIAHLTTYGSEVGRPCDDPFCCG